MRRFWILGAALLLAGCGAGDWLDDTPPPPAARNVFPPDKPVTSGYATVISPLPSSKCEATARQRAADTENQDFGPEVQQTVYDATYADCMKWAKSRQWQ